MNIGREFARLARAVEEPEQFERFLLACEADARGRKGFEDRDYPQPAKLRTAAIELADDDARDEIRRAVRGVIDPMLPLPSMLTPEEHRDMRAAVRALADVTLRIRKAKR